MTKQIIRLLFIPREPFPTDRVRINVLFGSELLGRGHEIDLVMQAADERVPLGVQPWFGRTVLVGPTDSKHGFLRRLRKHWLGLWHDLKSLGLARPSRYDAIMVSDKFLTASIAAVVARSRGLKFIFWLTFPYHELYVQSARERTARYPLLARIRGVVSGTFLYKWILPRSDHVFVQSDRMKLDICAHGISATRVSPIVTGFDPARIPARTGSGPEQDSSIVLAYLGTLDVNRHLDVLVDMLANLRNCGMDATLLMVGDAENPRDRLMLERRAEQRGVLAHLEITGFLPQAQAWARVQEADLGLSPFYPTPILTSTSPTKLVEYMALGLPVVANDHPDQRLVLRESRAGIRVPWGAQHFARAVRWLMKRSPSERAAMGARGRAWAEANRTYARIADEVERTCLTMLGREAGSESTEEANP
jgi:glycosyltransferase involved in cell wall biosynthesis